jgi:hypothetical protein
MRAKFFAKHFFCFIAFTLTIGLTGCFKGDISVDVKANGTGIVSIAFGMTQQAKALVASQGENPLQDIRQSMSDGSGSTPTDVGVTKWIEGDYEWTKAEKEFKSLDEINRVMRNKSLFNKFSLTCKRGVFQDEYILDAELDALNSDVPVDNSGVDPSAFIEMSFSARMPGKIVETNGFADLNDANRIVWNMQGNQAVSILARSTTWNWLNIFGIMVGGSVFVLFGIYAMGGFDAIIYPRAKKTNYLPQGQGLLRSQGQPALPTPIRTTNYIVELGVEDLLNQVNTRTLNSSGQIHRQRGEMGLVWKDALGKQRFIYIKDLGNHQIAINGQNYPATRDNAKSGIMTVLQKQK